MRVADTQIKTGDRVVLVVELDAEFQGSVPHHGFLTYEADDNSLQMAGLGEQACVVRADKAREYGIRTGVHPDNYHYLFGYVDEAAQLAAVERLRADGKAAVPVTRMVTPWVPTSAPSPAVNPPASAESTAYAERQRQLRIRTAEKFARRMIDDPEDTWYWDEVIRPWLAIVLADKTEQQRTDLWTEYAAALEVQDGVGNGTVHWTEVEPALVGPDRDADALDIARQRTADALTALIGGAR